MGALGETAATKCDSPLGLTVAGEPAGGASLAPWLPPLLPHPVRHGPGKGHGLQLGALAVCLPRTGHPPSPGR